MKRLFTSESVTAGHPDKICDQISDSVLDAYLNIDSHARVACETCVTNNLVFVTGEISSIYTLDIVDIIRSTIAEIGYTNPKYGFDSRTCSIITSINKQSSDIAQGVNHSLDDKAQIGAGDQGMMFGFACDETPELMPAPISFAHSLCRKLANCRIEGTITGLRPDGKSQVTVEYNEDNSIKRVDTVVISAQHDENIPEQKLHSQIVRHVIMKTLPQDLVDDKTRILINPTGRFVTGGPCGDSGLTGRKIIVDTYGGYASHGGGCFSGKDPTKVDRSAAYMARYVAKNIVAANIAKKCQLELAYAIGVSAPVSIRIDTFGTGVIPEKELLYLVNKCFDFRPAAIIELLDLQKPIYKVTAAYGHFGRTEGSFSWEKTDKIAELLSYV